MHFVADRQIGVIAQDVEKLYPEVVFTDKEGYKSVDYAKLTPVLIEAIKEQQNLIEALKQESAQLKAEATSAKSEVGDVKSKMRVLNQPCSGSKLSCLRGRIPGRHRAHPFHSAITKEEL